MTSRRRAIEVMSLLLLIPFVTMAQQQLKVWRIGYLDPRTKEASTEYYASFISRMRELGYVEGKNLMVDWRLADGSRERMRGIAAEFARAGVDVILTDSTPAVRAATQATKEIPIVVAAISDPVALGFAKSFARPGGNVTGFSNMSEELIAKRLEILVEIAPSARRIAFLANSPNEVGLLNLQAAGKKMGRTITLVKAETQQEIETAFARIRREKMDALIINQDGFLSAHASHVSGFALRHRLPSIGGRRQIAEAGALVTYGVDYVEMFRRAANFVDKIIKGAKPGDVPIEQPTKFEMVVNLKTAKALGITLPPTVMVRATKVIE